MQIMARSYKYEPVVRTALLWAITQRIAVIPYRRFGTTYGT